MNRMLRLEVKRSVALPVLLVMAVLGAGFLWMRAEQWSASWPGVVQHLRGTGAVALPMALGFGVWHGSRERRAGVGELFATTPRPRASRLLPAFVIVAGAAVLAHIAVIVAAGAAVHPHATSGLGSWPLPLLAGLPAVAAAALLGTGIGRLVPGVVATPLCVIGLYVVLITNGGLRGDSSYSGGPFLDTLMPMLPMTDDFHRVLASLSVAHIVWFAALAVTGVLLALAGSVGTRIAALAPAAAGLALGTLIAPSYPFVPDTVATATVCAPEDKRICVAAVHAGALPSLVGPAGELLDAYAGVPGGATRVREDTAGVDYDGRRVADADAYRTVPIDFTYSGRTPDGGAANIDELILAAAAASTVDHGCEGGDWEREDAAATGMAMALLDREQPPPHASPEAVKVGEALRALPAKERDERIAAGRKAGLTCGDPLAALSLEAGR